jgi:hypothetical protein
MFLREKIVHQLYRSLDERRGCAWKKDQTTCDPCYTLLDQVARTDHSLQPVPCIHSEQLVLLSSSLFWAVLTGILPRTYRLLLPARHAIDGEHQFDQACNRRAKNIIRLWVNGAISAQLLWSAVF